MGRKPNCMPSFFKIFITDDFTRQLRVPPVFVQKHGGCLTAENVKLRISSGETWDVKLERMNNEQYYFTMGWTEFVQDIKLEKLEFLVFRLIGKSTFDVYVYGILGCERQSFGRTCRVEDSGEFSSGYKCMNRQPSGRKNKRSRTRIMENEGAGTDDESKSNNSNPYFEIVLKRHQLSRVCIRKHFAEAAGLIGKKKVAVEYPGGQRWNVVLDSRSTLSNFKLDLAVGWSDFRKANKLRFGRTYSFEFIPSRNVIEVKQIKRGK
ncbi:B3 domain-containing protein At3g17010-like [Sesamum indicum]|uniref:B3 domain-containing protein At3g17010-like n=1 Tax=Sesamum indicum TaxID=4182 RepID=A0A6I9UDK1_SESIN|nr:B3 domain-containing protein At3g17010-like [Sesamum indicum]